MNQSFEASLPAATREALEILLTGCAQVVSREELAAKLARNQPLRVKLGVDPTAPDIHLGHTVGLTKLRQFQDLGHQGVLIIGDFTAMIGDPSGRSATRPQLTREEVLAHAATYQEQAFKVLDPDKTEVVFNGDWFRQMNYEEVIRLNSRVTLQQMLQRDDFRQRLDRNQPIRAHEIQYPMMQGWDSVVVRADVELGGKDQLLNVMVGRDLQAEEGQERQVSLLLPILEGTDGVQKMSKSLGNSIGVTEHPSNMFGLLMSIPDQVMASYYSLLLGETLDPQEHPMEAKKRLARTLVTRYHSAAAAAAAAEDFAARFSQRDWDSADLPGFAPGSVRDLLDVVSRAYTEAFAQNRTRSEIRRLIEQGSIQWQGEKLTDPKASLPPAANTILKLDKKRAVRLLD
jgi:tyrosyl-tRNA synthetase